MKIWRQQFEIRTTFREWRTKSHFILILLYYKNLYEFSLINWNNACVEWKVIMIFIKIIISYKYLHFSYKTKKTRSRKQRLLSLEMNQKSPCPFVENNLKYGYEWNKISCKFIGQLICNHVTVIGLLIAPRRYPRFDSE